MSTGNRPTHHSTGPAQEAAQSGEFKRRRLMRIDPATTGLQPKLSELTGEWRFWEMKTPNMHRGIVDYQPRGEVSLVEAETAIRQAVLGVFRPGWWRGFAYGAVIQFSATPSFSLRDVLACVDSFNRNDGVLQWIVAVDHQAKTVFAVHMWMQGYLHNLFLESLDPLVLLQYSIEKTYKDQPAFFQRIGRLLISLGKTASRLRAMQAILGGVLILYLVWRYVQTAF